MVLKHHTLTHSLRFPDSRYELQLQLPRKDESQQM